jgi:archaea-specific DNA-binding protein
MTGETMDEGKDNTVFVGTKPFMNYVTSLVMQFTTKGADEVFLKARGKFISKAVDIVEVTTKRFMKDKVRVKVIHTNSEDFKNKEGRDVRVSTIEITLEKME